jgi:hypothetical protein
VSGHKVNSGSVGTGWCPHVRLTAGLLELVGVVT